MPSLPAHTRMVGSSDTILAGGERKRLSWLKEKKSPMKIVSLSPSATEIICALGLADQLVAVTHECDYPAYVTQKPFITRSLLPPSLRSGQIDEAVRGQMAADAHSLYHIDRELLAELAPDLIVTQQLCEVCAVDYGEVLEAIQELPKRPRVLN